MANSVPGAARDFVRSVTQAVEAAVGRDRVTYDQAIVQLVTQPAGGRVLGDLLRSLLEDTHPDGFNSDDISLVVGRCYRAAATWLPADRVDATVLLAGLAAALGVQEAGLTYATPDVPGLRADEDWAPDDSPLVKPPAWLDYAWHAPLLIADLLPFAPATLGEYLQGVFAEYAREAREELP